jgi:hypothetical protein
MTVIPFKITTGDWQCTSPWTLLHVGTSALLVLFSTRLRSSSECYVTFAPSHGCDVYYAVVCTWNAGDNIWGSVPPQAFFIFYHNSDENYCCLCGLCGFQSGSSEHGVTLVLLTSLHGVIAHKTNIDISVTTTTTTTTTTVTSRISHPPPPSAPPPQLLLLHRISVCRLRGGGG